MEFPDRDNMKVLPPFFPLGSVAAFPDKAIK
jgi:hypothetical protein